MAYDNQNSGLLSRNERKQQPSHPDFQGQINVAGVDYWLAGWSKEAGPQAKRPGMKFISLSVKPKDAAPAAPRPATPATDDDMAPTPIAGSAPVQQTQAAPSEPPNMALTAKANLQKELDGDSDCPF